jgi:hypothetical protein
MAQFMPFVKQGERVMFLVPAGDGFNMVQRVRVAMSRARKELRRKQKPMIHFRLHHSIMPWTEAGKRHDAVILWSTRDETHEVNELLEDVFRNV